MKKLLLSLAGVALAMSANATLYVVGAGDGLTWDLPGKTYEETSTGSKIYEFTVTNLSKFKASLNNSSEWDGDNSFNAGAYGTGGTTFGSAVYPDGQTLSMVAWGEDQEVPWQGDYTITMDFNTMKMTAKTTTPQPTVAPAVYIRGAMNSWGSPDTWKFTNKSYDAAAGTGVWEFNGSINGGQEFKIADSSWGNINYGGVTGIQPGAVVDLTYNQGNMSLAADFTGTVTFTITAAKTANVIFQQEGDVKDPEAFYVIGTLKEGAWNPTIGVEMTNEGDGIYLAKGIVLVEDGGSCGFAITAHLGADANDWGSVNSLRFGPSVTDTPAVIGENTDIAMGDLTWSITPGTYDMTFDYANKTLEIAESKTDGVAGVTVADGEAVYYNLQGVRVANPERGIFVKVQNGKAIKVVK